MCKPASSKTTNLEQLGRIFNIFMDSTLVLKAKLKRLDLELIIIRKISAAVHGLMDSPLWTLPPDWELQDTDWLLG